MYAIRFLMFMFSVSLTLAKGSVANAEAGGGAAGGFLGLGGSVGSRPAPSLPQTGPAGPVPGNPAGPVPNGSMINPGGPSTTNAPGPAPIIPGGPLPVDPAAPAVPNGTGQLNPAGPATGHRDGVMPGDLSTVGPDTPGDAAGPPPAVQVVPGGVPAAG